MYALATSAVVTDDLTVAATDVLAGVVISSARVYGSDVTVAAPPAGVSVIAPVPTVVVLPIAIAFALPVVRAVTATAAIRIFFIDILRSP